MSKGALNMNELIGISYFYLKRYFGKDIDSVVGTYMDKVSPEILAKIQISEPGAPEPPDKDVEDDEITERTQAPGNKILERKGEVIAEYKLNEYPVVEEGVDTTVSLEIRPLLGK
jgi:hypothetical protein